MGLVLRCIGIGSEFWDPKFDSSVLWDGIWPNTTNLKSSTEYICCALDSLVFGTPIRWRSEAVVSAVYDLTWACNFESKTKLPFGIAAHPAHARRALTKVERAILGTQHFEHRHNT